jgi:hypothetical protein
MPKKISLENQTRLGIGASALFVILSWLMSFFSLWVSVPILLICGLAGFWGLRPFIPVMLTKGREHWNGTLSRYAPPAGFALLGIGVGVAVANGWHVINFAPNTGRINWNLEETASGRGVFLSLQISRGRDARCRLRCARQKQLCGANESFHDSSHCSLR